MIKLIKFFNAVSIIRCKNILFITFISICSLSSQNLPLCLNAISSQNTYSAGVQPRSVVNVDLNSDGDLDIAVVNQISNDVNVFLGNGNGGFSLFNTHAVGSQPLCIIHSDFNNDGNVDLATANYSSGNISILLGNGSGAFTVNSYTFGTSPVYLECGDFNSDGNIDLASANGTANNISIMFGSGTGTFSPITNYLSGNNTLWITKGDFNNDGNLDLASANYFSSNVSVLIGSATGTFAAAVNYSVPYNALALTQNDFNGDGNIDLAVSCFSANVSILFGSPTGTFSPSINYSVLPGSQQIINVDVNNDGHKDLITAHLSGENSISILLGSSTGSFTTGRYYCVGENQIGLASGDHNGDGIVDLVFGLWGANSIATCLGRGNAQFVAGVNYHTGGAGLKDIASADFNNDGFFDVAVCSQGPGKKIDVFLGTAAGTLQPPQTYTVPGVSMAGNITTGDYNNDGRTDVAAYTGSVVEVLLATVNSSFSMVTNTLNISSISSGDFNGDGKIDLVGGGGTGQHVAFCAGIGNGYFSPPVTYNTGSLVSIVCVGDFNNDGNKDVVTGNNSSNAINVVLGNGFGGFSSLTSFSTTGPPDNIICSDLNNDNNLDLVTVNGYSYGISVLLGQGNGTFPTAVNYTASLPRNVFAADLNGDNKKDILIANNYSLVVLMGNGAGSFTQTIGYPMATHPIDVTADDFNGDNKKDVALIIPGAKFVTVFLNGPALFVNPISPICLGSTTTLSVLGADTYSWNTNATTNSIIVSPTTSSTYTVFTTTTSGCSNMAVKTVSVHPSPTISVNNGSVCIGNSFTITPTGASSYSYESAGPVVTPTTNQTYTIIGASAQGCTNTAICNVIVNPLPTITVNSGTICSGNSFTMIPAGAMTYSYSSAVAIVTPTVNETFTVTGTNSVGCTNSITSNVTVNSLPSITVNSGSICVGQSFTMNPSGALTYTFSNNNSVASPTISESYTVAGTSVLGCTNSAVSVVSVQPLPTISVSNGTLCLGNSFTISPTGAVTYSYVNSGPVVTPTLTESFTITGSSIDGCTNTVVSTLTVFTLPAINSTASSTFICIGETATLTASGANSYSWSSGGTNSIEIAAPSTSVTYTVTGFDNNGCSNSSVISISVSACTSISNLAHNIDGIRLYPNPTTGLLIVESTNNDLIYNIYVQSSLGQIVSKTISVTGPIQINIDSLPAGSYLVKISSDSFYKVFNIIKE